MAQPRRKTCLRLPRAVPVVANEDHAGSHLQHQLGLGRKPAAIATAARKRFELAADVRSVDAGLTGERIEAPAIDVGDLPVGPAEPHPSMIVLARHRPDAH